MIRRLPLLLAVLPATLSAQAIAPGEWTGRITVRDIVAPGVPGFMLRMARGKSKSEKRCVAPAQAATGAAALLAPDPKAKCTVASQHVANGRYDQVLMCPQKKGAPLRVVRAGTYSAAGIVGQVTMEGSSPKGAFRFAGDQAFTRTKATCG
jgi:hypothetical protein